jgi:Outer membrane protein beta-barrel domain
MGVIIMIKKIVSLAGLSFLLSTAVHAEDAALYFGVKVGNVSADISGYDTGTSQTYDYDNVSAAGVIIGYRVDRELCIEGEFTTSLGAGDISSTGGAGQNEWDLSTFAVHGVYKSRGFTHVRLKAGLTYAMIDQPDALQDNAWAPDDNAASFSYGIGLGIETGTDKEIVIEWTRMSDELSMLGVGINF